MIISREIYFNVPAWAVFMMYALTAVAAVIYLRMAYQLLKRWRQSQTHPGFEKSQVFRKLIRYVVVQKSLFGDPFAGVMHMLISWGFLGLFGITLLTLLEADTPLHFLEGRFYVAFSFMADLFGMLLLLGLLLALWRRIVKSPQYLSRRPLDLFLVLLLLIITLSGFLLEGLRIALNGYWEQGSPIGSMVSLLFWQASIQNLYGFHFWVWFVHLILVFGMIFLIPYTKLAHALAAPLNMLWSNDPGTISPLPALSNIGRVEYLGIGSLRDFSGKNLMDIYACAACGICEENCPAVSTQKQLSPKRVVQSLRNAQTYSGGLEIESLDVWNCTTCGYCTKKCPVSINHQELIWGLKTYLTTLGRLPAAGAKALENIEYLGDPWGTTSQQRSESRDRLKNGGQPLSKTSRFVLWTGCSISYDQRLHDIAVALVRLLNRSDIDFTVISGDIGCCGDPARRLGEEGLFQKIARNNILQLNKYAGSTLLAHCPHCYHTLKNDYPQFGLEMEVKHHSEVILELMQQNRLEIPGNNKKRVVYHDPCHLGRHNNLYEPVRKVLRSSSAFDFVEPARNRESALCCGGGGGHMWLETQAGLRAGHILLDELVRQTPDLIVTACPYCTVILEDAVAFKDLSKLAVKDIAELIN